MAPQHKTQTQQRPTQNRPPPPGFDVIKQMKSGDILQELLARPVSERAKVIGDALDARIDKIEEMLPDFMKGQGPRLAKRAQLTFARDERLEECPPGDFIRCVLEAAEFGFAIDGKLAYVVKYKQQFQMQLDYKAMVAVAKRMKTIRDIYADVVYETDIFRAWREDGKEHLIHERQFGKPRGEAIGAYAVVVLSDHWRYELMDRSELDSVQNRAPSKKGPWSTDTDEMRRKTIVRKTLKMYADDPGVLRMLELTDEEIEVDPYPAIEQHQAAQTSARNELAARLAQPPKANGATQARQEAQGEHDQTAEQGVEETQGEGQDAAPESRDGEQEAPEAAGAGGEEEAPPAGKQVNF